MQIPILFLDESSSPETLQIENKLGKGKFNVYKAYSPTHQTDYALKVFPNDMTGAFHFQKEQILSGLSHPNIIKCTPITCQTDDLFGLLTELAQHGDFLKLTMKGAFKSEALVRTYFHQLIEGMEYLHSQGVAHLDLKLDNIVLGSDYKLKIIDFDQAQPIRESKLKSRGSQNYRPPEVIDKRCKNLTAVDVYSAGIILFALIAQEFPFLETTDEKGIRLQHYSTFVKDNNRFWNRKASHQQDKTIFNEDLIKLLNGMLEHNAEKRLKLNEIKESKWYQGPVLAEDDLKIKMKQILDLSTNEESSHISSDPKIQS